MESFKKILDAAKKEGNKAAKGTVSEPIKKEGNKVIKGDVSEPIKNLKKTLKESEPKEKKDETPQFHIPEGQEPVVD